MAEVDSSTTVADLAFIIVCIAFLGSLPLILPPASGSDLNDVTFISSGLLLLCALLLLIWHMVRFPKRRKKYKAAVQAYQESTRKDMIRYYKASAKLILENLKPEMLGDVTLPDQLAEQLQEQLQPIDNRLQMGYDFGLDELREKYLFDPLDERWSLLCFLIDTSARKFRTMSFVLGVFFWLITLFLKLH